MTEEQKALEAKQLADGAIAHKLHQQLLKLRREATANYYQLGLVMKQIRDNRYWETLGYDSFLAYFSDPELAFDESGVYRAIKLVEKFPDYHQLANIPIGKLLVILPHVNEENKSKLLELAASLPRGDLYYQLGPGKDENKVKPIPKIYRCRTCEGIKGISHLELCLCGWPAGHQESLEQLVRSVDL